MVTLAEPMSPRVENFTPSLVTEISTVSPIVAKSLPAPAPTHVCKRNHLPASVVCSPALCYVP